MATKRILTSVFFIAGVTLALLEAACSIQSASPERRQQMEALREENKRREAESAAAQHQRTEEYQRRIADPGSLSTQESDAEIAALRSASSFRRISAAEKLGDAKGSRAVTALIAALRTEKDAAAFTAIVDALFNIHDGRALDAYVDALEAPGMPDNAREHAFNAIVENRSEYRLVPQIRRFYESLTDRSVKERVRLVVERYSYIH
jgi:HEAT repeat protein